MAGNQQSHNEEKQPQTLGRKYLKVAGVVALYWTVSIILVFVNKYLLKSETLKLDAPLFVTFFQCVVTVLLCVLCDKLAEKFPNNMSFPSTKFDPKLSREALPISLVFVGMITFNNLCLRSVGVAFYTVARSLVTIFGIIFTYLILGKKTSVRAMLCCTVLITGFMLGVNQEDEVGSLSVIGVIYGVIASAFVALNAIYIKKLLPVMDNNIWKLTYYNNVNACAIFLPMMLLFGEPYTLYHFPYLFDSSFWIYMSISGFFGFIMGYVVGLEVQVTTPVTHTISGVAKACLQTVIAVLYFGEIKTALWWLSNLLVLCGTGLYSVVKSLEMKKQHVKDQTEIVIEEKKKTVV